MHEPLRCGAAFAWASFPTARRLALGFPPLLQERLGRR
jgi:hypothetical protein